MLRDFQAQASAINGDTSRCTADSQTACVWLKVHVAILEPTTTLLELAIDYFECLPLDDWYISTSFIAFNDITAYNRFYWHPKLDKNSYQGDS